MGNQQIRYGIGFDVDNSGLQRARQELKDIEQMTLKDFKLIKAEGTVQELNEIKQSAKSLQDALEDSFNPKLGTVNVEKFSQSLKNIDIKRVETQFAQLGAKGSSAFRNMTAEILTTQREVKQTSNLIDSMAKTLGNTIKWSIASSAINTVTGKIQEAWGFTKKLDASLNDIRIVTGKSADEMERFAKQSNKAAKDLGAATTNYTNAALIYYQQGLDEKDVAARSNVTVKAANVTGQSASEVSEQLTAVWNGYKVVAEEAELYVDKLAAVAATTAADLEELSTGMSKVASAAHTMGVDVDQLSAQLATIVSVTRQDANVVGTALKTIYARMGDLKVDGVDEFGTSLGDVSSQMQQMGINVLDETGNLRDMGEVIEEVAAKWGTWTDAQQQAAAVAIAGKRQYNNLIALFENWDMYESSKSTSEGAMGTLQKQQEIYMDSLEARLQRLGTAGERVFDAIFDSESMKDFIDGVTVAVDRLAEFVESIGGGGNLLLGFGSIAMRVFSSQIAGGISKTITNLGIMKKAILQNQAELEIQAQYQGVADEAVQEMIALKQHELKYSKLLTEEQKQQYALYIKQTAELYSQLDAEKEKFAAAQDYYQERFNFKVDTEQERSNRKRGYVTTTVAAEDLKIKATRLEEQASNKTILNSFRNAAKLQRQVGTLEIENPEFKGLNISQLRGRAEELKKSLSSSQSTEEIEKYKQEQKIIGELIAKKIALGKANSKVKETVDELRESGDLNQKQDEELLKAKIQYSNNATMLEESYQKALLDTAAMHRKQADIIENNDKNIKNTEGIIKNLKKVVQDFLKNINTTALIEGIVTATAAAGQLATALKSIGNIDDIWNDDSIELGDKVLETVMAVSSAIGMLTLSYKSLKKGITEVIVAMNLQNTSMGVMLSINQFAKALDKEQNDEKRKLIISRFAEAQSIKLTEKELDDLNQEKTTELILDRLQEKEELQGGKNLEFRQKGTKNFNIKQILASGGGIKGILGSALKFLGPIAIIIGSIVTIVNTVKKAIKNDSDLGAEALSKAAETAQIAKENFSELTQQYTELKNALEDHTAAQKAIDDLITGTQEWKDAVRDANMEVLDLLDKYPTLAKYIKNTNGRLIITNEGSEAVLEAQEKAKQDAYQTSLSLQAIQKEAENNREIQQGSADTFTKNTETKGAVGGAAAGALGGAAAVALASTPIGWVAGAIIAAGAAIGSLVGHMQAKEEEAKEDEAYEKAIKALEDHGNSLLVSESKFKETLINQYGVGQQYVDALWENKTQLEKNYDAIQANTAALQIQRETGWKDYLGQYSEEFKKSKYQDEIAAIFASQESDAIDLQKENIISSVDTKGFWNFDWGDEIRSKKEIRALADLFQQENLVGFESTYDVDKQNKRVTFTGTDGQTKTLSIDSMVNMLAAKYNKTDTSEDNIRALNTAIETLTSSIKGEFGDNIGQSLADAIAGKVPNLANLGRPDFNTLNSKIAEVIDENGIVDEAAAATAFGFNTTEDFQNTLSSLGYENITEYINKIKQGLDNYQIELNQLGEGLFPSVKTAFDSLITDTLPNASLQIQKSLQDSLKTAFSIGGEEGVDALKSALSESNFTEEEFAEFFNLFNSNNWNDFNAWENFVILLEDAGYGSLFAADSWSVFMDGLKENTDQVINSTSAVAQFGNALNSLKEFKSIEIGSIIDKEKYDELIKGLPQLRDAFIDLGNDTYFKKFEETPLIKPNVLDKEALNTIKTYENFINEHEKLKTYLKENPDFANPDAFFDSYTIQEFLDEYDLMDKLNFQIQHPSVDSYIAGTYSSMSYLDAQEAFQNESDFIQWYMAQGDRTEEDAKNEWAKIQAYSGTKFDFKKFLEHFMPDYEKYSGQVENNTLEEDYQNSLRLYLASEVTSYEELQKLKKEGHDSKVIDEFTQTILAKEAEQLGINLDVWENYSKSVNNSAIAQDKLLDQLLIQNLYEEADALALIDDQLEQVNNDLDNLKDAKERAYGTDVLENLQQQIEKEEEIAKIQMEKYERNNKYLAISKNNLSELYNPTLKEYGSEYQIEFDENGLVTNESYDAILALASQAETKQDQEMFLSILTSISDYNDKVIENQESYDQAMQDKVNNILDHQIEQNKYLYEIKNSFYDLSKQINDLNRTFGKWDGTLKSAFEEESVGDIIANAEQDFNLIYDKYINTIIPQMNDLVISMVTNVDDYNALRDKVGFAEGYNQEALQAEVDKYNSKAAFYLERYQEIPEFKDKLSPNFIMKDENGDVVVSQPVIRTSDRAIDAIEQNGISQSKLNAAKILTAATLGEAEEIFKEIASNADVVIASAESKKEQARKDVEAAEKNYQESVDIANSTYDEVVKMSEDTTEIADATIETANSVKDSAADALELKKFLTVNEDNPYVYIDPETGKATVDQNAVFEGNEKLFADAFSMLEEMQAELEKMFEAFFTAQEQIVNLYDKEINKLSTINSVLQTSADIWKLIGKNSKGSSAILKSYYGEMTANTNRSYELALMKLKEVQEEYDKVMALGDEATQEMINSVTDALAAATEALATAARERLDAVIEEFNVKLDAAIDDFLEKSTGLDLTGVTEAWEQATKADEDFLDEVNSTYAIEELERKIQKSIDETDSVSAQKKLNAVMQEQLQILREKDKLSQYDVDRANALYELTLKQIALDEAQRTMSKMKLTRDAMGNYTYQYVADGDAIADAEAELAAVQNDVYNLDKDRAKSLADEYYSAMAEAKDKINEAFAEGDMERADRLSEYYFGSSGLLAQIQSELGIAQDNLNNMGTSIIGSTFDSSLEDFFDSIGNQNLGELGSSIKSAVSSSKMEWQSASAALESLLSEGSPLVQALKDLEGSLKTDEELGTEVDELHKNTTDLINKLTGDDGMIQKVADLAKLLETYAEDYKDWLKNQTPDIENNTKAMYGLTEAVLQLTDYMTDYKINGQDATGAGLATGTGITTWDEKTQKWISNATQSIQ